MVPGRTGVCVIAHANGGSRGPRKDRPVLLTVLHHVCVEVALPQRQVRDGASVDQ